jgi:hypothetical protein
MAIFRDADRASSRKQPVGDSNRYEFLSRSVPGAVISPDIVEIVEIRDHALRGLQRHHRDPPAAAFLHRDIA